MLWHRNCGNMPLSWERTRRHTQSSAAKGDYSDGLQTDYRGSELAAQAARGESREPALARYPANQRAAQADDAGLRAGQGPGRIFDHAQRPRRAGRPGTGNPNRLSFHAGIAVPRSGRFRAPRFSFAGRDAKRSRPEYAFRTENTTEETSHDVRDQAASKDRPQQSGVRSAGDRRHRGGAVRQGGTRREFFRDVRGPREGQRREAGALAAQGADVRVRLG